jgi:hypothetical protein
VVVSDLGAVRLDKSVYDSDLVPKENPVGPRDIIVYESNQYFLTEICNNQVQKKIMFPFDEEDSFSYIVPDVPTLEGVMTSDLTISSNVLTLYGVVLGTIQSKTDDEIVFRPTTEFALNYDRQRKVLILTPNCSYKIQYEKILIAQADTTLDEVVNLQTALDGASLTNEELANQIKTILEQISQLKSELDVLTNNKIEKDNEYSKKLLEFTGLVTDFTNLTDEISKLLEDLNTLSSLNGKIIELTNKKTDLETAILSIREEIDNIITIYNAKRKELESKSLILSQILAGVQNECQLRSVIALYIVPLTKEKQKYNIKNLEGDITPSKLIRVDE